MICPYQVKVYFLYRSSRKNLERYFDRIAPAKSAISGGPFPLPGVLSPCLIQDRSAPARIPPPFVPSLICRTVQPFQSNTLETNNDSIENRLAGDKKDTPFAALDHARGPKNLSPGEERRQE